MERSRIRLLSEALVVKIAAGEVIERPASIVKELLENSVDAGAGRIEIRVTDGGRDSISVTDDGCGIPADEVPLAFARHATSKLTAYEDLFHLSTLGFRGEALASIGAVSKLDLLTKPADQEAGTFARMEGGEIKLLEPRGAAPGMTISVSHLFFNAPARKKFLRSKAAELSHVETAVRQAALTELSRTFLLESDGEVALHAPAARSLRERIGQIYGTEVPGKLVAFEGEENGVRVSGWISGPELTYRRASDVWFFVNRRPVRDRTLQAALNDGYRTALLTGRYPLAVVSLDLLPERVDVNVHPTKAEVRFSEPQTVFHLLSSAISAALRPGPSPALRSGSSAERQPGPSFEPRAPSSGYAPTQGGFRYASSTAQAAILDQIARTPAAGYEVAPYGAAATPADGFFSSCRTLGRLDDTYLILERDKALVVVDQHAAHERVKFDGLKKQFETRTPEEQRLLLPITMEVTPSEAAVLETMLPFLGRIGFSVENFGPRTFVVTGVPATMGNRDPRPLLKDLIADTLLEQGKGSFDDRVDDILARIACHSAVRAHDPLSDAEIRALLTAMDGVELNTHCPHGRPTYLSFRLEELERRFRRT